MTEEQQRDIDAMRAWLAALVAPIATFFEGRYVWLCLIPASIWFYLDRALLKTWISLVLMLLVLVALAFQVRKVLMPQVDIQEAAKKAQEDPVGAALVFLGGIAFMIAIVIAGVLWLGNPRA